MSVELIINNIETISLAITGLYAAILFFKKRSTKKGLHQLLVTLGEFNDSKLAEEIYKSDNKVVEKELPKSGAKVIETDSQ